MSNKSSVCSKHGCDKEASICCSLCNDSFCKDHIEWRLSGIIDHYDKSIKHQIFVADYRKKGGHPCPNYYEYLKKREDERSKQWTETLDKFTFYRLNKNKSSNEIFHPQRSPQDKGFPEVDIESNAPKYVIGCILGVVLFLLLHPFELILSMFVGGIVGLIIIWFLTRD